MRVRYVAIVVLIAGVLAGCGEDDLRQTWQAGADIFTTPTMPPAPPSSAALIALAPEDGRELWRAPAPHEWTLTTFLTDETVYAYASDDGALVAIDLATHEQRWTFQAEGHGWLPVPTDGTVYIPKGQSLLAVDERTGTERWSVAELTPLAANAELVFASTRDDHLDPQMVVRAFDAASGEQRWERPIDDFGGLPAGYSAVVASDDQLFIVKP